MERKIALLIDAENTSVKYIDVIISELKKYGDITFQRMYGDFSNGKLTEWTKRALEYAIVPIHQSVYKTGKNAADIMLVIDAMDIMYRKNVDVFCLVSSDSDFTRLANRLREDAFLVVGMGMSTASKTFVSACNEYKFLDKIYEETTESTDYAELPTQKKLKKSAEKIAITPIDQIQNAINSIVQQAENKGERAVLGSTKSQLQRAFPDFDERNYGYTLFRKFVEETTKFILVQEQSTIYIVRKEDVNIEQKVFEYIREKAKEEIELGLLGNGIHSKFPSFRYKDLGYSQFSKFVSNVEGVTLIEKRKNKIHVGLSEDVALGEKNSPDTWTE